MKYLSAIVVVLLAMFAGCGGDGEGKGISGQEPGGRRGSSGGAADGVTASPLKPGVPAETPGFHQLASAETGIDFLNTVTDREILLDFSAAQAGLATGDYDQDGDLDVYLCGMEIGNRLYRNDGDFKFSDVTDAAGTGLACADDFCSGAVFCDLTGDGWLDLYVCNRFGPNKFFVNDGTGQFSEEAQQRGLDDPRSAVLAAPFDADQDGDLDLYVGNYRFQRETASTGSIQTDREIQVAVNAETGEMNLPPDLADDYYIYRREIIKPKPHADALLINDGTGNFTDGTEAAGLLQHGWTNHALACDFTEDGMIDIYVAGDFETPDYYFVNNGDGTFTNQAETMLRRTSYFSMGADAGDVNGDGMLDIFVGDMKAQGYKDGKKQSGDMNSFRWELINFKPQQNMQNALFLNRGQGWMTELGTMAGVKASEWTWSCRIADLNCSGIPELLATNGFISIIGNDVDSFNQTETMLASNTPLEQIEEFILSLPPSQTDNVIFTAAEPLVYKKAPDNWGMQDDAIGCGATLADFDGDGDLDCIINNTNAQAGVWRNDLADGQRVLIDLVQPGPNRSAVGARIWAHCGDDLYTQEVILSRGYATGESAQIHLGLGEHAQIDRLEIRWPDGKLQEHTGLAAGMHYTIERQADLESWKAKEITPLFAQSDLNWSHEETDTVAFEYSQEPLLPIQRSLMGSGGGVADYDQDGKLDLYLAGAAGQTGQLFKGDGQGGFVPDTSLELGMDIYSEEMSVLWFEANGDGRPDLLISCGSIESRAGSEKYLDTLLLNTEGGLIKQSLPVDTTSTGSAAAADIDHDGDLDLLLAGRLEPYSYMSPGHTMILMNDGAANFTAVTEQVAPGLAEHGVISDAQFGDMNGDGWADLVLALEFGSIEVWLNNEGSFEPAGAASAAGMWQSLGLGDFDNDGDTDILAGNWGWNTKYHPSEKKPMTLLADDFDSNGTRDLIEVKYGSEGSMLPGRGRSCSGYAIEYIPQKWPTWSEYADATLEEIYGSVDEVADRYDAVEVHTQLLINDGNAGFTVSELPMPVQYSVTYGVGVGDFNLDGNLDAMLAQNFAGPQPEAGRWISGYSTLLMGDGTGGFAAIEPLDAGILIGEDARGVMPADLDGDGWLDLVISVSNAKPKLLINQQLAEFPGTSLLVNLLGRGANPNAIGAQVVLRLGDGKQLMRECQAGSGYLSSYLGPIHFGIPAGAKITAVDIRWPDGSTSSFDTPREERASFEQPVT